MYHAPSLSVWYSPTETGERIPTNFPVGQMEGGLEIETRPVRWYHLQVRNTGRGTAVGCTAKVENLEVRGNEGWEQHPTFVAHIPLVWAHSGQEQHCNIEPRDGPPWDKLDLFTVEPGESLIRLVAPYSSGRGVQTNFRLKRSYRLTVSVEDDEGRTSATAQVTVKPARNADGELKEPPVEVHSQPL